MTITGNPQGVFQGFQVIGLFSAEIIQGCVKTTVFEVHLRNVNIYGQTINSFWLHRLLFEVRSNAAAGVLRNKQEYDRRNDETSLDEYERIGI